MGVAHYAVTLPTGCSWIQKHLEHPPSQTHLWSNSLAWSNTAGCQSRWNIGCRQAGHEMQAGSDVAEARGQALAHTKYTGHIDFVRKCNAGFKAVYFG